MTGGEVAAVAALFFAILNPFVKMPIFLQLAAGYSKADKRRMAMTAAVATLIALLVIIWFGLSLLELLEVSIEGLQVAGGALIFIIGLSMVLGPGHDVREGDGEVVDDRPDGSWRTKAVVPLAIPMIVGGGAISIVATVMSDFQDGSDKVTDGVT